MKIAVVGAGIFGTTVAIALAKAGFTIDLIEKEPDILCAASGINQFRLHRGYHYPRSIDTALSSKRAEASFRKEYGEAVIDDYDHYYCIATTGSKISKKEFMDFCSKCGLEFSITEIPHALKDKHEIAIKVRESIIDPAVLKSIIEKRLKEYNVNVILNTKFSLSSSKYDLIINCTYANLNSIHENASHTGKIYQFEICEKPVSHISRTITNLNGSSASLKRLAMASRPALLRMCGCQSSRSAADPVMTIFMNPFLSSGLCHCGRSLIIAL